jgi:hypothetical protein
MHMRTVILILLLATGPFCLGQKSQLSFHFNSGLFWYGGYSANETSSIHIPDIGSVSPYTNNPYGKNSSFSWGFGTQFQKITNKNFIYGIQLGYESLSSKLDIVTAWGEINWLVEEGKTILTTNFVNIYPSIGQRFKLFDGVDTDLLAGFDFGIGLSTKEHYSLMTSLGNEISGTNDRDTPNLDFRPRIELVNYYKSFGLTIGYSHGLTNYQAEMDGANREVFSRYLRLGLSYRLN